MLAHETHFSRCKMELLHGDFLCFRLVSCGLARVHGSKRSLMQCSSFVKLTFRFWKGTRRVHRVHSTSICTFRDLFFRVFSLCFCKKVKSCIRLRGFRSKSSLFGNCCFAKGLRIIFFNFIVFFLNPWTFHVPPRTLRVPSMDPSCTLHEPFVYPPWTLREPLCELPW